MKHIKNLEIKRIWYWGVWIAETEDGKKVLIKWWALPWSIVDCNIKKNKKDYMEWHITQIHKYDPKYLDGEIFCPHFFSSINKDWSVELWKPKSAKIGCGWCKRQLISYPKQLELKQEIVEDCFRKIKQKPTILPIVWSPSEKWYRNKIEFSFGVYMSAKEGIESKRNLGFHKQWEFSKIIDIDNCGLISPKANKIFEYIKDLCIKSWLPTYDQKFNRWFFRHLVIREGSNTWQFLINLAVFPIDRNSSKNEEISKRDTLKEILKTDKFLQENVTTFVITYNDGLADIVKWPTAKTEILFWSWYIYESLKIWEENINFRVSPFSFFQTNTHWAEKLFQTWIESVWEIKWKILDLYCGTGSIGISFLKTWVWESLLWIEIVEEAIKDANHNAEINWIEENCKFVASPSEKTLSNYPELQNDLKNIWLIIVDPPRDWLHKNVINWIESLRKDNNFKILYISCNPSTMARDIEIFIEKWFNLKSLQPLDMFPQTHHIETVWVLI